MGSDETREDTTRKRIAPKRKRETPASRAAKDSRRGTSTPNAYARRSPPRDAAPKPADPEHDLDADGDRSPPRKLKRPGGGARVNAANREAAEQERKRREDEARRAVQGRLVNAADIVADHYNAVPERGRDWRNTESKIKGLRSLNNWIKSTLIQKFSRPEVPVPDMKVIDLACGKGGDLGKWEKAPQVPVLYVGCDIANVSIQQAQQRFNNPKQNNRGRYPPRQRMQAEFHVHDTFAHSLIDIPLVRSVGFNPPSVGPGGVIQGGMMTGGFDVVSMMFALHYSFETETLAKGMLSNVSGALKKGGRFIGVMPNSDVISAKIKTLLAQEGAGKTPNSASTPPNQIGSSSVQPAEVHDWDPEKPADASDDDEWDPEKPSDPQSATNGNEEDEDDWDPEKPSDPSGMAQGPVVETQPESNGAAKYAADENLPPLTWGNSIYTVRFHRQQPLTKKPLPRDGVFRPPFGWKYNYHLEEAVDAPEYVVPWEAFRALAEDYGLELLYRKGFREVFEDESEDHELGMLAERMNVMSRDRSLPNGGLLVNAEEMDAASFYHAFVFYKT